MGRYDQSHWRENGMQGPRSYDRDERYGRPRMSWENDQDRGIRSESHRGGLWRDEREGRGDRYEGQRGREEYQRAMVRPEERGWDDRAERDDYRAPRSYERDRQAMSAWEREPAPSMRGVGWYGSEHARDEHDHYRGYGRQEHHENGRSYEARDRWDGRGREVSRYERDEDRHGHGPYDRAPAPREHRPEDDFGKVSGRFDDERYSGTMGGHPDRRPSSRVSPDAYGMRMVRPGDRPSHDLSNDDEHYGYGRSERGHFDQPEDDRYGRSRRTPYENNWR